RRYGSAAERSSGRTLFSAGKTDGYGCFRIARKIIPDGLCWQPLGHFLIPPLQRTLDLPSGDGLPRAGDITPSMWGATSRFGIMEAFPTGGRKACLNPINLNP